MWYKDNSAPGTGLNPSFSDRKFYNVTPELAKVLQTPSVDAHVAALQPSSTIPDEPKENFKTEDRRADQTLHRTHQATAWAVKVSTTASFFNMASLLWLHQMTRTDVRMHRDISKLVAAVQFLAHAMLNVARFASRAIASSVATCRLLWLCPWQADTYHKWQLALPPFKGERLFGESLYLILVESRDKRKVMPSMSRKGNFRPFPYFHQPSFRAQPDFPALRGIIR